MNSLFESLSGYAEVFPYTLSNPENQRLALRRITADLLSENRAETLSMLAKLLVILLQIGQWTSRQEKVLALEFVPDGNGGFAITCSETGEELRFFDDGTVSFLRFEGSHIALRVDLVSA